MAGAVRRLTIARCERHGRYHTARLVERHGASMTMGELLALLSADCPRHGNPSWYDRCDPHCPDLARLLIGWE